MDLSAEEIDALDQNAQRIGLFFRLDTSPVVRLWAGVGPCKPGVNTLDPSDGGTYNGCGELTDIPAFQNLINGAAERVEFTLSPVSQAIANIAVIEDVPAVKNKPCAVGFGIMDEDWQLIGPVHWPFQGIADYLGIAIQGASDIDGQTTRLVKLSVGNGLTGRKRRGFSYWTDQDHQRRVPGDRFCERTALISQTTGKTWPRY